MKTSNLKKLILIFAILLVGIVLIPKNVQAGNYSKEYLSSKFNEIRNTSGYKQGEYYKWNDGGWYSDYCSSGHAGWQCHGYGINLFDWLFQQCAMCSGRVYNMSQICVGDLIRYNNAPYGEHTVIVQDVVGDTVYFTDANGLGDGTVRWDQSFSKSYFQDRLVYIAHASGNDIKSLTVSETYKPSGTKQNLGDSFVAQIIPKSSTGYAVGETGTSEGSNITLQTKNTSSKAQQWKFTRHSDGSYGIVNVESGYGIDIENSGNVNGENVRVWGHDEGDKQSWFIYSYNGGYRLVPRSSSTDLRALDINSGSFANGTNVQIWEACNNENAAQTFILNKYVEGITLNYSSCIINKGSTKALTATVTPTSAYSKTISWSTSNSSVAKVSSSGVITGVGAGTATITAKATDGSGVTKTCTVTVKNSNLPYSDVTFDDWFYSAVEFVHKNNYMSGTVANKTFSPNGKITRGMMVTILYRMEGEPAVTGTTKFKDVTNTSVYYYKAVKWASDRSVVNGYGDGTFKPNDNITREQLTVMLSNYCRYKGKYKASTTYLASYSDGSYVSQYAIPAMKWAVGNSVITGNNNKLNPKGTATRAETASMIYKYCKNIK